MFCQLHKMYVQNTVVVTNDKIMRLWQKSDFSFIRVYMSTYVIFNTKLEVQYI